ncbi:hypothetical protein [Undibacterium sp.]|uniref:hypothetical protein n=1 Tax=Undibacterium sp. TaxID=1914977 RepID=UPI003752BB4D
MNMLNLVAATLIFLTGLYFICLGVVALGKPAIAARFLLGFATSAATHYVELFFRIAIGFALVFYSHNMLFAAVYLGFGYVLIVTTSLMFLIPWRWHRAFTEKVVPYANAFLGLIGLTSLAFGVTILASLLVPVMH